VARQLVNLFKLRFDPQRQGPANDEAIALQLQAIGQALDKVSNLNDDRVLRQLLALIQATLRTNFWRTDEHGARRAYLSFKLDPAKVPGLPPPAPMFEIFVYSTRFEGVHLRGGKVARGGLRWSDRPEDFRTEVLGLVKAQMVKNTVIVPVGSKGGFVLKKAPPATDREAYLAEGVACYKDFLRGLLDLTDNIVAGQVVPPPQTVRHRRRRPVPGGGRRQGHRHLFRLRQRGEQGVRPLAGRCVRLRRLGRLRPQEDGHHRARRVGECQAALPRDGRGHADHRLHGGRHRRHVGRRVRQRHAAVAHIRLLAAFDHRHVFIDPDPDAAGRALPSASACSTCRARPGPTTTAELISAGGGVWPRSAKSMRCRRRRARRSASRRRA
jgi:glutamate dehydrogenase